MENKKYFLIINVLYLRKNKRIFFNKKKLNIKNYFVF